MRDMSHEEAAELLPLAALDALDADDQTSVLAHAAACPECGPALAALRDAAAQLAFAVPQVADDPVRRGRARNRLLARARADLAVADRPGIEPDLRSGSAATGPAPRATEAGAVTRRPIRGRPADAHRTWWASPGLGWGVALAAGLAAIAVVSLRTSSYEERLASERAQLATQMQALRDSVQQRDQFISSITGKEVSTMQLTAGTPRAPWAWMFWDHATNRWTLLARNLPTPAPGRTYQLWLVTPRSKISAGTFNPSPNGAAEVQATYALAPDSLRAIAVTEEPTGGAPQPTGPLVVQATAGNRPG